MTEPRINWKMIFKAFDAKVPADAVAYVQTFDLALRISKNTATCFRRHSILAATNILTDSSLKKPGFTSTFLCKTEIPKLAKPLSPGPGKAPIAVAITNTTKLGGLCRSTQKRRNREMEIRQAGQD